MMANKDRNAATEKLDTLEYFMISALYEHILSLPNDVPFEVARNLWSNLLEASISKTVRLSDTAIKQIESLASLVDEAIEETAKQVPGALEAWRDAKKFDKEGREAFNTKFLRTLTEAEPGEVLGILMKEDNPANILGLRDMVGEEDWRKIQGAYLRRLNELSTDQTTGMVNAQTVLNRLEILGEETVTAVFGEEKHKEIVEAYREIAKRQKPPGRVMGVCILVGLGLIVLTLVHLYHSFN